MKHSPEAIRANEELLERTLASTRSGYSIYAPPLLEGKIHPQSTDHPDLRTRLELQDMARFYDPPLVPTKVYPELVTRRTHKTQVETEADAEK